MSQTPQKGHPKGLYLLFFTEMWERFSYYGMRAILILFLTKQLLFDKAFASDGIYGSFTGLVYLTPIIGGYIADRYWGNRKSIFVGGILMALGQFLLFFSGSIDGDVGTAKILLYIGLGLLILGNGFFKPNISTMVGQLYPANDVRLDGAYTIFYMGINLGAFMSPLICGYLGENIDFRWGFFAAGIGMLLGTFSFELLKNKYLVTPTGEQIGRKPAKAESSAGQPSAQFSGMQYGILFGGGVLLYLLFKYGVQFDMFGSLIFSLAIVIPFSIIMDKSLTPVERSRIGVIFISAFFVIFFWSAFEQAGASLTFFADEQTNRQMFANWVMPASWFNSFNAIFIVIFAPIFSFFWVKLNKAGIEPPAPRKQAFGLLLLALGYLWIAIGVKGVAPGVKVSMALLTGLYLIHTWGELCLSPIGLSMVNKLAPIRFASLLMGVWFLANATANKFAGILSGYYPDEQTKEQVYTVSNNNIQLDPATTINWESVTSDRNAPAPTMSWAVGDTLRKSAASGQPDSLSTLILKPGGAYTVITDTYKVRRAYPDPLKPVELKKMAKTGDKEPKFIGFLMPDGKHFGILRQGKTTSNFEVWDLYPKNKSFMGYEIKGLYDFFMIFVFMAGFASLILFLISGMMRKMMHGVR